MLQVLLSPLRAIWWLLCWAARDLEREPVRFLIKLLVAAAFVAIVVAVFGSMVAGLIDAFMRWNYDIATLCGATFFLYFAAHLVPPGSRRKTASAIAGSLCLAAAGYGGWRLTHLLIEIRNSMAPSVGWFGWWAPFWAVMNRQDELHNGFKSGLYAAVGGTFASAATALTSFLGEGFNLSPGGRNKDITGDGRKRSDQSVHGVGGFAGEDRLAKMRKAKGWIVGQESADPSSPLYYYDLESHAFMIAPAGGNKDVFLNCNLLAPPGTTSGPVFVADPQGEAFFIVSTRRAKLGRRQILLDPQSVVETKIGTRPDLPSLKKLAKASKCNPFMVIKDGSRMVASIQKFAECLFPPPANSAGTEKHFIDCAQSYWTAACAWWFCTRPRSMWTIGNVIDYAFSVENQQGGEESALSTPIFREWLKNPEIGYGMTDFAAKIFARVSGKEMGSIISTMANQLKCFVTPDMREATASSDFAVEDVVEGNIDIYPCIYTSTIKTNGPWMRMLVTMMLVIAEENQLRHRWRLIINEGPAWGRIPQVEEAFRVMRKAGVSVVFISQDVHILYEYYGQNGAKSLMASAELTNIFSASRMDRDFTNMVSDSLGEADFITETESENDGESRNFTHIWGSVNKGRSRQKQIVHAKVMTADQIASLPKNQQIVMASFAEGERRAILSYIPRFFERHEIKDLAGPNPYREDAKEPK